jgi:FMN phosphatase YigB (HAD superfamily)
MTGGGGGSAVLLDIGGTLWPDAFAEDSVLRVHRVAGAIPESHRDRATQLVSELVAAATSRRQSHGEDDLTQDTLATIEETLRRLAIPYRPDLAERVRSSMVVPASKGRLFPGARELLAALRGLDVRVVAVSNTVWRRADDYLRDFELNDVGGYFDAVLTSPDARMRKPDPRIFERALSGPLLREQSSSATPSGWTSARQPDWGCGRSSWR